MKKVPHSGHTNISHHSDMAPRICGPLMKRRSYSGIWLEGFKGTMTVMSPVSDMK